MADEKTKIWTNDETAPIPATLSDRLKPADVQVEMDNGLSRGSA